MERDLGAWERPGKKKGDLNMRIVRLFWAIVAVALIAVAPAGAQTKDWKKIRIGTEGAYAINFSSIYAAGPGAFAVLKSSALAKLPGTGETYPLATKGAEAQKAIDAMKPLLKGKVVGAQVSTTNLAFVEKYYKDIVDIRSYKTTEQHDLDLAAGRIDAAFAAVTYWNDVVGKPEGKDIAIVGPQFSGEVLGRGVAAGLRKEDSELKAKFDGAIKAVLADGTCKTLSVKWFKGLDICAQ